MNPVVVSAALAGGLFVALLLAQYLGRALGKHRQERYGDADEAGAGAVAGAVFALLGLLLAFTFTGADSRFEHRRDLVVQQVNALGTAWMRIDLLPTADQPPIRDLFRRYVDGLRQATTHADDPRTVGRIGTEMQSLQNQLWRRCVDSANRDGRPQVATLLLPPLNDSFDLTTTRLAAVRIHVHPGVIVLLVALAVLAGLLAGHAQAITKRPDWLHMVVFAALISATLYFILDFEYPRLGLITLDSVDTFMNELRASLND